MRAAYAGTKAIGAMTRSFAMEFGPAGIRVNAVAPGVIDTAMWADNKAIPGVWERVNTQIALRRWAPVEEVADVIFLFASDAARYITAQTISVDGGQALRLISSPVRIWVSPPRILAVMHARPDYLHLADGVAFWQRVEIRTGSASTSSFTSTRSAASSLSSTSSRSRSVV
jgi:hypothetical protein